MRRRVDELFKSAAYPTETFMVHDFLQGVKRKLEAVQRMP